MKILIAEDDFTSRKILQQYLKPFGDADIAVNGKEVVSAFSKALKDQAPYELVCLDIMMPEMDGQTALTNIRKLETNFDINYPDSARIIMTTALSDGKNVLGAFKSGAEAYLTKPIDKIKLYEQLEKLGIKPI